LTALLDISRREFLRLGLAGGAMLALPFGASACSGSSEGSTGDLLGSKARLPQPFQNPLPVPPVLEPVSSDADADYYEMTQKAGEAEILPGLKTEVWGYEGVFPGPTIESRSGRKVVVRHWNELPVPVSTHLHGGKTPPESDGYPTDLILPMDQASGEVPSHPHGEDARGVNSSSKTHSQGFKEYEYPNEQRAATLWYHDHRMDFTGLQVYKGLAGFHIVRDDEEDALPLPNGKKDVPMMICDRSFGEDGSFLYPSLDPSLRDEHGVEEDHIEGVLGDTILVNGAPWPYMEVSNTMYRFRVLNASNARRYELVLDPEPKEGASFVQIGSDGGLLGTPLSHHTIPIAQAERFDVVIDFSKYPVGTKVAVKNLEGEDRTADVMQFRVTRKENEESAVPARLSDMSEFEALEEGGAMRERKFRFSRAGEDGEVAWGVNGEVFAPERIDARPELGSAEIWRFVTDVHHPVHLHLARFKVLSRNGQESLPTDAGWKDTVDVRPGEIVRVLARFDGYRGKYVFHCHNLEHEDMMMMANFEVV
jgi:spore coat protein A, manganese oxidase